MTAIFLYVFAWQTHCLTHHLLLLLLLLLLLP